jgi:hypothetical protein
MKLKFPGITTGMYITSDMKVHCWLLFKTISAQTTLAASITSILILFPYLHLAFFLILVLQEGSLQKLLGFLGL